MSRFPRHICITGGGTAGWLAALILGDAAKRAGQDLRLTVIESSKLGTIGVGEGTTAVFRQMLQHLGISETAFLRETGATIKYGIRHKDWRRVGHTYDGPIDDVAQIAGQGLDHYALSVGKSVADVHLFHHLMKRNRAPFAQNGNRLTPAGPFHFAYHFDQARAGAFLKRHADGVRVIDSQVIATETDTFGITALRLENGQRIGADFYIDCTGFRRAVISALGAKWLSYADVLPVNRAMPFWLEHDPQNDIAPYTLAQAMSAGWMWQIPTQERIGCGYVYSDKHLSANEAHAEVETLLGHKISPRADIPINAGRLQDSWIGNCVALGLSASFLEPLEATSIHGTIVQLMLLSEWIGTDGGCRQYNATHARQVDEFRDFIRTHYISDRRDTAFWREVAQTHPAPILAQTAKWRSALPQPDDFARFPLDLPHVQQQLYIPVLDGLGLLDKSSAKSALSRVPKQRAQLRKTHAALTAEYAQASGKCLKHRAFLKSLNKEIAS